jgi:hypothetical protein
MTIDEAEAPERGASSEAAGRNPGRARAGAEMVSATDEQKIEITKMRGQPTLPGLHTFRISAAGLQVFAPPKMADAQAALRASVSQTVTRSPASYFKPQVMHRAIQCNPQGLLWRGQVLTIENGARNSAASL